MTREDWEAESMRRELEHLRMTQARENDERRLAKEYHDEAELQRAKRELDEIKRRETQAEGERRIKKELEHKRLKEEQEAAEEKKLREKEAEAAVERYKQKEAERFAKEAKEREAADKEYRRRLQEDLVNSGVDEKAIAAIMKKEKVPEVEAESQSLARPTYTRMARKHLSIETLRTFSIEWDYDTVRRIISQLPVRHPTNPSLEPRVCSYQALGSRVGARYSLETHSASAKQTRQIPHD